MRNLRLAFIMLVVMAMSLVAVVACDTGGPPAAPTPTATVEEEDEPTSTAESRPTRAPTRAATRAATRVPTSEPTSASTGDWDTFTSAEGRFSVEMPGEPREDTSSTNSEIGELTLYTFVLNEGGVEYTLVYVDYPEIIKQKDPETALQDAFKGVLGTNTANNQEMITVEGNPGLVGDFQHTAGYAWYKAVLVDTRLYQLIAIGRDKDAAEPDAARFLDSFRLGPGGDDPTEEPEDEPTEEVGDDPTPATKATATTGSSQSGQTTGMSGTTGNMRITINGMRRSDGSQSFKPAEGNEYLILDVTFENTGSEEEIVSQVFSKIAGAEGTEYNSTFVTDVRTPPNGAVQANGELSGEIAYEVPKGATGLVFIYEPFLDEPLRLNLDS